MTIPAAAVETRERLVRLEIEVQTLTKMVSDQSEAMKEMAASITKLNEVLAQAKGARWALMAMVGAAGFVGFNAQSLIAWIIGK